ncbi:hypothetical protein B0H10DRAFT_2128815 [Mycena sp. CBHHK59/15]|nr:hypothetical protein B0H10DRAFT_2128815 [Mycena sp. CBHHK59/15]
MHLALGNFSFDQVLSPQFILLFVICQVRSGEVSAQTIDGGNGPGLPCLRTGSCGGVNPRLALAVYSSTLTRSPMSNATLSDPLAPNFALLPPDLARKLQLATFVTTGSLAIFIWDILHCLSAEYTLLFKYKAHWSLVAYFLSKFGSFGYVLGFTLFAMFNIVPVSNSFYPVAVTSIRTVTAVFGILWLAPTPYCIVTEVASFVGASTIVITVHDTAVFLAVSYRLVSNTHAVHAVFSGTSMPCFSKALYVDGQLITCRISAFSNIAVTVMVYAPHLHQHITRHGCRVYRNTKLGTVRESTDVSLAVRTIGGGSAGAVFIAMTKTTQTMRDPPDSREARSEAFES